MKLFTRSVLTDPQQGRTLIQLLGEYVPSWLPHRYGWSVPLRNVYDPDRFEEFWTGLEYNLDWRNAKRTATGHVTTRLGPRDTLSSIELKGQQNRSVDLAGLPRLLQDARPGTGAGLRRAAASDLAESYEGRVLPEPDSDLCLWLTVANIPAGAPPGPSCTTRARRPGPRCRPRMIRRGLPAR